MKKRSHLIEVANCGTPVKEAVSIMDFEGDLTTLETFLEQYRKSMYGCKKCAEIPVTNKYLYEVVNAQEIRTHESGI